MRDDYRKELAQRDIKVEKSDFNIDNMLTTMRQYYRCLLYTSRCV